jgi:hypothetical protein
MNQLERGSFDQVKRKKRKDYVDGAAVEQPQTSDIMNMKEFYAQDLGSVQDYEWWWDPKTKAWYTEVLSK